MNLKYFYTNFSQPNVKDHRTVTNHFLRAGAGAKIAFVTRSDASACWASYLIAKRLIILKIIKLIDHLKAY